MTESLILEIVNTMCEESLSPDQFEAWEDILHWLKENRKEHLDRKLV